MQPSAPTRTGQSLSLEPIRKSWVLHPKRTYNWYTSTNATPVVPSPPETWTEYSPG